MGKNGQEDQPPTSSVESDSLEANVGNRSCWCRCFGKIFGFRCVLVLILSIAVFLSAIFWLPPFLQSADQWDPDLNPHYRGHDVIASFYLERPVSLLKDNSFQLEGDILVETGAFSTKVHILSLEPIAGTNITKVVFAVDPEVKNSKIPAAAQSLIKWTFQYLVIDDPPLRLTASLFGDPFLFEVLKFPGGITIVPSQKGFLLQTRQTLFNFTLNFSIHQIQARFGELKSQLKLGLHLDPYENLYVSLFNSKGSTVAPPTTVLSSVLLAVGNTPSKPRLKQLAQTIKGSPSRNLGLNHTVFGKVKQVRLSSILQHSLSGGDSRGLSPSSAPSPQPSHHPHRHKNSRHQHGHVPAVSPAPANAKDLSSPQKGAPAPVHHSSAPEKSSSAPQRGYAATPPGCPYSNRGGFPRKPKWSYMAPIVAPKISPLHAAPVFPPIIPPRHSAAPPPMHKQPPIPASGSVSASSPLPSVQLPSKGGSSGEHSHVTPSVSPSTVSSFAGSLCFVQWALLLFLFPVFLL